MPIRLTGYYVENIVIYLCLVFGLVERESKPPSFKGWHFNRRLPDNQHPFTKP